MWATQTAGSQKEEWLSQRHCWHPGNHCWQHGHTSQGDERICPAAGSASSYTWLTEARSRAHKEPPGAECPSWEASHPPTDTLLSWDFLRYKKELQMLSSQNKEKERKISTIAWDLWFGPCHPFSLKVPATCPSFKHFPPRALFPLSSMLPAPPAASPVCSRLVCQSRYC